MDPSLMLANGGEEGLDFGSYQFYQSDEQASVCSSPGSSTFVPLEELKIANKRLSVHA
jgi:hypothetical protein